MPEGPAPRVGWLTGFLDLAPGSFTTGADFWTRATGTTLSTRRGDKDQFATLLPDGADACWRVQELDEGGPGTHLDLYTDDLAALEHAVVELGASVAVRFDDLTVLRSPGGLLFCVVGEPLGVRPEPVRWGGHTSMLDQVCLDVPEAAYDAEVAFWATVLEAEPSQSRRRPELTNLRRPAHLPLRLLLQRVGDAGPVAAHPDLATTDRVVEVARLEGLGARTERVEEFWTVLRAPDGRLFCVTERDPATGQLN